MPVADVEDSFDMIKRKTQQDTVDVGETIMMRQTKISMKMEKAERPPRKQGEDWRRSSIFQ